jgi:hypothetical protein
LNSPGMIYIYCFQGFLAVKYAIMNC